MRPDSVRRWMHLGACVTATVGLFTAGLVQPAFADEPQSDQLWIDQPSEQTLPLGVNGADPESRPLDVGLYHDNTNFTVTDGRLTIDTSGLAGVAEVTWPENCTPNGATAVCDVPEVPVAGPDYTQQVHLGVRAAEGAAAGAQGRITYEASATGGPDGTLTAPQGSFDTTLTVGSGPDLALADMAPVEHAEPGERRTVPFRVTNSGNDSAHGLTVEMFASYGLQEPTEYDGCTRTQSNGDDFPPSTTVRCSFDEVLAPGDSFELPEPLAVTLAGHALNERLDIDVQPAGGVEDLQPEDNFRAVQIGADNTADFSVTGDAVSGSAGETVQARLTFRNHGPAWFANLGSGEPVANVRLVVPKGTTVTGVPDECGPHTLSGGYYAQREGAPRYDCALPYWVLEDTERSFVFSLRIDKVLHCTTGAVSVRPPFGEFEFDPDLTNNSAVLAVN